MFFVRSNEQSALCAHCSYQLAVSGSRRRGYNESSGEHKILVIRRLYCQPCERIHHELPDMLVPYKRYDRDSIEAVIEGNRETGVSADETTMARWRRWFSGLVQHIYGALQAVYHRLDRTFAESADPLSQSLLQRIHGLVGSAGGWLGRVVRIMVLENLWVQTRSAFLTG